MNPFFYFSCASQASLKRNSPLGGLLNVLLAGFFALATDGLAQNPFEHLKRKVDQGLNSNSKVSVGRSNITGIDSNRLPVSPKATQGPAQQYPATSAAAISLKEQKPEQDKVLWLYVAGLMQMREGMFHDARLSFEEALQIVDGRFGRDRNAERARSYFSKEATKTFVGEPYERAMANFYLGILYWMEEGHNRARPCFRNALYEDSYVGDDQFASDYVLCEYLDAVAGIKSGQDVSDALKHARSITNTVTVATDPNPLRDPVANANVLVFVEFGNGPIKIAEGNQKELLKIRPTVSLTTAARLRIANRTWEVWPRDDVYFQAATRGGRVMDHVNNGKAVFKSTTDTGGNFLIGVGGILHLKSQQEKALGRSTDKDKAAGVLMAAGGAFKLLSAATRAEADTRCWYNLPGFLGFIQLELPAGKHNATIEYLQAMGGSTVTSRTLEITVDDASRDTVVFLSDKSG